MGPVPYAERVVSAKAVQADVPPHDGIFCLAFLLGLDFFRDDVDTRHCLDRALGGEPGRSTCCWLGSQYSFFKAMYFSVAK